VIGERKFAYDVWGDTVNLASRLQEHARAGEVLVSERTTSDVGDRYSFGPVQVAEIKGKGRISMQTLVVAPSKTDPTERASELEPS
jgi:adenylate cyclase